MSEALFNVRRTASEIMKVDSKEFIYESQKEETGREDRRKYKLPKHDLN